MSILIPNIKIPDHCWECPLMSHLLCGYSKEIIPGTKKRDDCHLVEVPNHGRLIDADALPIDIEWEDILDAPTVIEADESNMDSFIRIFEEDDEEDGMDSFIRILKD